MNKDENNNERYQNDIVTFKVDSKYYKNSKMKYSDKIRVIL